MELAVNYSPQAAALLAEGRVQVERFKCPDWDDLIAEASARSPVYVHFPLHTGALETADLERVERLLERTGTPFVNVHRVATPTDLPEVPLASGRPEHLRRVADWLAEEVSRLTARFGAPRVIAENVIYRGFGGDTLRAAVLPEVVHRVCEETGCGLLLDLSHARISAHYLGVDAPGAGLWEYLGGFPRARLRELHLSGIHFQDERVRDHLSLTASDRAVMGRFFAALRRGEWREPETVALEYGGLGELFAWRSERGVLERDLAYLRALQRDEPVPS